MGFLNRRRRVLEGQQGNSLESWRLPAYLGDKVVIGAGVGDGVVALDETIDRKTAGRKQDRNVDSFSVHVFKPGRNVNVLYASDKPSHIRIHSIGGQQGTAFGVWFRQMFPNIGIFLDYMTIRIDRVHRDLPRKQSANDPQRSLFAQMMRVNRNATVCFSGRNAMAISFVVEHCTPSEQFLPFS